jgi:hypothetical protein
VADQGTEVPREALYPGGVLLVLDGPFNQEADRGLNCGEVEVVARRRRNQSEQQVPIDSGAARHRDLADPGRWRQQVGGARA